MIYLHLFTKNLRAQDHRCNQNVMKCPAFLWYKTVWLFVRLVRSKKKNSNKISYKETISVTQILMFDNSGCEELAKKLPVLGLEGLCGHLDTAVVWMQYKV